MTTISIRLEDSVYEDLENMLDEMGQTKQTFYETFTKTALRERSIPFMIKAPLPPNASNHHSKLEAFERLEAVRKENKREIDFDKERSGAMHEKYGAID